MNTKFNRLRINQLGGLLHVSIFTGHRANAFCVETIRELTLLANQISEDSELRAVIVSGTDDIFTGGMNLSDPIVKNPQSISIDKRRMASKLGADMCRAWEELPFVTFAAINGACVGAGVALSLAVDFRVCKSDAILYVPEIERGMNMSWQSVPRSCALIGPAKTKRMFIMAEQLDASTAKDWGWCDYYADSTNAVEVAKQKAEKILSLPPLSVQMCKRSINKAANALNDAVSFMDVEQFVLLQESEDYAESISAFIEKRTPNYHGK